MAALDRQPERILLLIDLDDEMKSRDLINGTKTRIESVKEGINILINTKLKTSSDHKFALGVLQAKASWFLDFTNDRDLILQSLKKLDVQGSFPIFDFDSVINLVETKLSPFSPDYFYRVIIFYGRTNRIPKLKSPIKEYESFISMKNFCIDSVYLHTPTNDSPPPGPQEIYDFLVDFESDLYPGYCFEHSTGFKQLIISCMYLAAHPIQRSKEAKEHLTFIQ